MLKDGPGSGPVDRKAADRRYGEYGGDEPADGRDFRS